MKKEFGQLDILIYEAVKTVTRALVDRPSTLIGLDFSMDDEKAHTGLVEVVAEPVVAIRKDKVERYFRPKISFLFKRLEGEWRICQDSLLLHECPESGGFTFGITDTGIIVSSQEVKLKALRRVFE